MRPRSTRPRPLVPLPPDVHETHAHILNEHSRLRAFPVAYKHSRRPGALVIAGDLWDVKSGLWCRGTALTIPVSALDAFFDLVNAAEAEALDGGLWEPRPEEAA